MNKKNKKMRYLLIMIVLLALFSGSPTRAQSPPFSSVTITGKAETKFNKVCLFEKGGSKTPFKTKFISKYNGRYSIDVKIPGDMLEKGNYYYTDMRFWNDKNSNNMRDPGEAISQCHFIIWQPANGTVYMQVYKGPRVPFESSVLDYDYKQ